MPDHVPVTPGNFIHRVFFTRVDNGTIPERATVSFPIPITFPPKPRKSALERVFEDKDSLNA
jgi:hypothetical protein